MGNTTKVQSQAPVDPVQRHDVFIEELCMYHPKPSHSMSINRITDTVHSPTDAGKIAHIKKGGVPEILPTMCACTGD